MAKKRSVEILLKAKDNTKPAFNSAEKNAVSLKKSTLAMGAAMVTAGTAALQLGIQAANSFKNMVASAGQAIRDTAALGDTFHKMSLRVGLNVETLSDWSFILERAGTSVSSFELAFRAMVRQMDAARSGSPVVIKAFKDLGLEFQDSEGHLRDANDVFTETIDALTKLDSETEQMAASLLLFGRAGTTMLPVLRQTKEELQDQRDLAREAGVAYSQDFADGAAALHDALALLDRQADRVSRTLVETFGLDAAVLIEAFAVKIGGIGTALIESQNEASILALRFAQGLDDVEGFILQTINTTKLFINTVKAAGTIALQAFNPLGSGYVKDALDDILEGMLQYELQMLTIAQRERTFEEALLNAWRTRLTVTESNTEATVDLVEKTNELSDAVENSNDAYDQMHQGLVQVGTSNVMKAFKDEVVTARAVLVDIVQTLAQVIVKLAVIKTLSFFANPLGGLFDIGGFNQGGRIPQFQFGGQVPAFANGGSIPAAANGFAVPDGPRGRDSRLIMAAPGEEVINRSLSRRLNRFLTASEAGAYVSPWDLPDSARAGNTVVLDVGIPSSRAGVIEMQESVVEALEGDSARNV